MYTLMSYFKANILIANTQIKKQNLPPIPEALHASCLNLKLPPSPQNTHDPDFQ